MSDNAAYAYSWLQGRGYTPQAAAGVVGNLVQESGVNPGDGTGGGDGGRSHGIAQWNGSRLAGLYNYAGKNGGSPWNLDTQLGYLDWDLKNRETRAYQGLQSARDVNEATAAAIGFERPAGYTSANPMGGHGWANRLNAASGLFSGTSLTPVGTPGSRTGVPAAAPKTLADALPSQAPDATITVAPTFDEALTAAPPVQDARAVQAAAARRAALLRLTVQPVG